GLQMAFRRYQDLDRLFERRYAVVRFRDRPATKDAFSQWYANLSKRIENGLPPYSHALNVDSASFKTELRIVFENELMCSSFVRRAMRSDFTKNNIDGLIFVDREYVESTLSPDNKWLRVTQKLSGEKNTEDFFVKIKDNSEASGERQAVGTHRSLKRSGDRSTKEETSKTKSSWAPSPPRRRRASSGEVKKENDSSAGSDNEENEEINPNAKAISTLANLMEEKQDMMDTRKNKLKGAKKTSDPQVKTLLKEIQSINSVINRLRTESKMIRKEEIAKMLEE
ncbi:hypothetical protein PMAYCL1PPCAC_31447, partial [Pristionchus mayeri]